MQTNIPSNKTIWAYKTIWLSDVHLGNKDCNAEYLLHFLSSIRCETIYLVGDIIDLLAMKRRSHWQASHKAVLKQLSELSKQGTRIIYIPGNHDIELRDFCEMPFFNFELKQEAVHETAQGKKLLIMHGDQFDHAILFSSINRIIGERMHHFLVFMNRWLCRFRRVVGLPYWSLATYIKEQLGQARKTIEVFEEAAAKHAAHLGYDGIVCGHIHKAQMREIDGTLYCNDGDWTESCTALIENLEGGLELFHWSEKDYQQRETPAPQAA